jgi:archaellin
VFRNAQAGVDMFILLIAGLVLAAGAAYTFVQLSSGALSSATTSGHATRDFVSRSVRIVTITAEQTTEGVSTIRITLAPGASSSTISIQTLHLIVVTDNTSIQYSHESVGGVNLLTNQGNYTRIYIEEKAGHVDGELRQGELIELTVPLSHAVPKNTEIRLRVLASDAIPTSASFYTPRTRKTGTTLLFP